LQSHFLLYRASTGRALMSCKRFEKQPNNTTSIVQSKKLKVI
jgi:hypothetical protein